MSSFGEELRKQRKVRQITLQEIAAATKVNLRFLQALERDDFDVLPGGLFTRGFIRAYATHVGLDPEATVNAYLYEIGQAQTEKHPRPHHNPDLPRLQRNEHLPHRTALPRWTRPATVLLLTGGLLWFVVPTGGETKDAVPTRTQESTAAMEQVLEIVALRPIHVRLACGEENLLERRLEKEERVTFPCSTVFQLHAPRAESLRVHLNGEEVALPASPLRGWNPAEGTP